MKLENIRNFCIISHIDHGKSTLANALLKITNSLDLDKTALVMDDMELEQERGITIKLNSAQFIYQHQTVKYTLNLLDTPGHIDFNYEVQRAIHACQGAILLVDATKGIQAQTIANLKLAQNVKLKIIPVINKIDLPTAKITDTTNALCQLLAISPETILTISAKHQTGIKRLLERIITDLPPPSGEINQPLQALVFDAKYDHYRGVVVFIQIKNGQIKRNQKLKNLRTGQIYEILELGYKTPKLVAQSTLQVGQVGYLQTNIKNINEILVGDTLTSAQLSAKQPLLRFEIQQSNVFANLFPTNSDDYANLTKAIAKIALNDAAFRYRKINTNNLGSGYHCGFLGLLHLEIIQERLIREHQVDIVTTLPSVKYQFYFSDGSKTIVENINTIQNWQKVTKIAEPIVDVQIVAPLKYLGAIMQLGIEKRGQFQEQLLLNENDVLLQFKMPLKEIITNFLNEIKSATNGYGSFSYDNEQFVINDLIKLDILLNGKIAHAFSQIIHRKDCYQIGKQLCAKLKKLIPQQNFQIRIQAAINNHIIARENIRALQKDVTAKCYGGDITRKRKLWKKQKAGKKRMQLFGKIKIPNKVFLEIVKK